MLKVFSFFLPAILLKFLYIFLTLSCAVQTMLHTKKDRDQVWRGHFLQFRKYWTWLPMEQPYESYTSCWRIIYSITNFTRLMSFPRTFGIYFSTAVKQKPGLLSQENYTRHSQIQRMNLLGTRVQQTAPSCFALYLSILISRKQNFPVIFSSWYSDLINDSTSESVFFGYVLLCFQEGNPGKGYSDFPVLLSRFQLATFIKS